MMARLLREKMYRKRNYERVKSNFYLFDGLFIWLDSECVKHETVNK